MYEKENQIFNGTVKLMGGKWKLQILCELSDGDSVRFTDIKRALPGVSQRILTLQLRSFEKNGIVTRKTFGEIPPRVEYKITAKGKSLERLYINIVEWGKKHF